MATPLRVLILEDRPADAELILHELRRAGFDPDWRRVETEADYLALLDPRLDVILADYTLPKFDALHALQLLRGRSLDIPFLVVTGTLGDEVAVECIKHGAADYLLKDRLARLGQAVTHALQQKRLRDDNRRAQERLHLQGAALESAANAFVITDREGRILWVNPAFTRLTGYTLDEALGQNPRLLKSDRQDPALFRTLWETILAGRVWRGELINRRKDGSTYLEGQTITPVRDERGEISHFIAVKQDITQRKRAEEALAARTRQLEAVRAVTMEITRELDVTVLLRLIVRRAAELVDAESGTVFLWDEGSQVLVPQAWHGIDEWRGEVRLRLGEAVVGRVAHRQEGMIVNDYRTSPYAHPETLERTDITAVLAEPLLYRDRLVGVVTVDKHGTGRSFTEKDRSLLALFAAQAAIAIENARLHETALRRAQHLATLIDLDRRLTTLLDPQAMAHQILAAAQMLIPGCAGRLWELVGDAEALRVVAGVGLREPGDGLTFPFHSGQGLTGLAATTRKPVTSPDVTRDTRFINQAWAAAEGLVSCIVLPLIYGDRITGALAIYTRVPHAFADEEVGLLLSFAAQAAIAFENARLYAATERAAREARSLFEVAQSLTTSLDVTEVLHLVSERTTELLGTPHAQVILWDEATQTLRFGAAHGTEAEKARHQEYRLGEGVNGIVAQSREPLIANDYQVFAHRVKHMTEIVADIAVPLLYRGRLLGVLNSHATQPGSVFTQDHLTLLTSFANQAAVAIENARLYEQVKGHAAELEQKVEERTRELSVANLELQEVSRHKSAFLANMSHELRTPLNSIIGFAELLREQVAGALNEKQLRFLNNIWNSGKHLLQLISDILDISKVEAGKLAFQPEPLPIATTLEDILVIGRGLAHKKAQSIEVEIEPDLPRLQADPVRFKQILFNLLSNAVKFTPGGGTIAVRARRVRGIADLRLQIAGVEEPDPTLQSEIENLKSTISDCLEIAVSDTGIGIRPEDMPRLFQEFVQLEAAGTKRQEGAGLGLALTKKLVEIHDGRIWAESEGEGRGSTFTVLLPFSRPAG